MEFEVGFCTDIGRKRQENQDHGLTRPDLGLFIVADGMGGHRGGETASRMATEIIAEVVETQLKQHPEKPSKEILKEAIEKASLSIFNRAQKEEALAGMGTTTTAILFSEKEKKVFIGQVGDSRCYFLRPRAIWQLSRDHSLVQEKLHAGLISRSEVRTDGMKNVITRSVGFMEMVEPEMFEKDVSSGDLFLLCSDGLSGMVEDYSMLSTVEKRFFQEKNMQEAAVELVAQANSHGGEDNVTVILVQAK